MTRYPGAVRLCTAVLLFFFAALPAERGGLTAVVTAAATLAALTLLCHALSVLPAGHPVPPGRVRTALRDRQRRTAFLRQRDPDASGRPRPRAPGHRRPTAA